MTASRFTYHVLLPLVLILCVNSSAWAQRFSVVSFKMLPNDVSAFINPVRDLNDEDCALVKVIASEDFAFSTPLGIVKRIDKTGEIWLYLPRGSKKITIKHPTWGVLRDYAFPGKVVSHMAYELRIEEPVAPLTACFSIAELPELYGSRFGKEAHTRCRLQLRQSVKMLSTGHLLQVSRFLRRSLP